MSFKQLEKDKGLFAAIGTYIKNFLKAPATSTEKVLTQVSSVAQLAASVGLLPAVPPLSIGLALTSIFTWLDRDSQNKDLLSKLVRICSWVGQAVTAILAWPFALPAAITSALTAVHTFVDNAADFLDDGKLNGSTKI